MHASVIEHAPTLPRQSRTRDTALRDAWWRGASPYLDHRPLSPGCAARITRRSIRRNDLDIVRAWQQTGRFADHPTDPAHLTKPGYILYLAVTLPHAGSEPAELRRFLLLNALWMLSGILLVSYALWRRSHVLPLFPLGLEVRGNDELLLRREPADLSPYPAYLTFQLTGRSLAEARKLGLTLEVRTVGAASMNHAFIYYPAVPPLLGGRSTIDGSRVLGSGYGGTTVGGIPIWVHAGKDPAKR